MGAAKSVLSVCVCDKKKSELCTCVRVCLTKCVCVYLCEHK